MFCFHAVPIIIFDSHSFQKKIYAVSTNILSFFFFFFILISSKCEQYIKSLSCFIYYAFKRRKQLLNWLYVYVLRYLYFYLCTHILITV